MSLLSLTKIQELQDTYGRPIVIDDVIRLRAKDELQVPILAYPKSDSLIDYELLTGTTFDRFIDQACWTLIDKGLEANEHEKVVALFAESDLSYSVTMLALLRLGYRVMTISIRLGPLACRSLLDRVECKTLIHGSMKRLSSTLADISSERPEITMRPILSRSEFDKPEVHCNPFVRQRADEAIEKRRVALIMHSSGSTGYPKPLFQCHEGVLLDLLTGMGCRAFNPLPWFHLHGFLTSLQAIYMQKTAYLWNSQQPLTAENIITAIRAVKPEIFHGVPYTIKLLSEMPEGIELLRQCHHVTSGGARPPDELGEKLIKEGVHFSTTFGLTETGHIGDSMRRESGDRGWDYLRLHSYVIPHMVFNKISEDKDDNTYEGVFLKSHPALLMSNSNDPPGSYHSGDIFIPHASIPNAWKYIARNDDCITLANGEKINPMAMEGVLRQHPLTRDALMFGVDQPSPGMLIFQSRQATGMSAEEYMSAISLALQEANGFADNFARVSPDMVVLIAPDVEYPVTDKNNIIRAAAYRIFNDKILSAYNEQTQTTLKADGQAKKLQLGVSDLEKYIVDQVKTHAKVNLDNLHVDFFSAGIDSLMAIQLRRNFQRDLDLGGVSLASNVVYDARNAFRLARLLYRMRTGANALVSNGLRAEGTDHDITMESLINTYGAFEPLERDSQQAPQEDTVVLTGATGALGAHLLQQLLQRPSVRHVYCLVRAPSADPRGRVLDSLAQRGIDINDQDAKFINGFSAHHTSNLQDDHLGLSPELYHQIRSQTTLIVHAAWPVHFKLPLASFETHIAGFRRLLELSFKVPWKEPARVLFTSSIATALGTPRYEDETPALVAEGAVPSLSHCLKTGYAQSKLVCERMCERAAGAGGRIGVLRIGQLVGDVKKGIWNPKEAIPLMIHSALAIGALPILDGEHDLCEWMPVDSMAEACLQVDDHGVSKMISLDRGDAVALECSGSRIVFYNLVAPHSLSWGHDVLPALKQAGLQFETVSLATWLSMIRNYTAHDGTSSEERLPAMKLIDYYEELYGVSSGEPRKAKFDLTEGVRQLPALRDCPRIIDSGLVAKFLRVWMDQWSQ